MRVLIIGASGGIGAAWAADYAARGAEVTGLSRRSHGLDLTDEASILAALAPLSAPFDRILVTTGALELNGTPPEKSLRALDPAALAAQFALNTIGPVLVLKHGLRLMPRQGSPRFAALSARVGSISDNHLGGWYGYRAAKAALNQMLRTAAVEVARSHPQAVLAALHPGHVATALSLKYGGSLPADTPATAAARLTDVLESLTPAQSGGFFDYAGRAIPW